MIKIMMAFAALLAIAMPAQGWKPDAAGSAIRFQVKGPFGTVNGSFSGLKADIRFDPEKPDAAHISASVDAATISTGIGLRNRDLRKKEEWFNTDKYPRISFRSTKITAAGKGFTALGELTLKDVSREVNIPFVFIPGKEGGIFRGNFSINREDYHLGKPGGSVGNTVAIMLQVQVKK